MGNTKTRLALQIALAERSLLESWGAAWNEFGRKLETLRVEARTRSAKRDPKLGRANKGCKKNP